MSPGRSGERGPVVARHLEGADEARADIGDRRGLGVALLRPPARVGRKIDRELGDAGQAVVAILDRMRQRDVARLLALRQDAFEAVVARSR